MVCKTRVTKEAVRERAGRSRFLRWKESDVCIVCRSHVMDQS